VNTVFFGFGETLGLLLMMMMHLVFGVWGCFFLSSFFLLGDIICCYRLNIGVI